MAETTQDLGYEHIASGRIQAGRGTTGPVRDPRNYGDDANALVTKGVQAQLVEDAGYVRVRHTGTQEIVFNHKYWLPGETRVMHPADLEVLRNASKGNDKVSFEEISHQALGELVAQSAPNLEETMGQYHVGADQIAAIELGLVPAQSKAQQAADVKFAQAREKAEQDIALRDAQASKTDSKAKPEAPDVKSTAQADSATPKSK